MIEKTRSAFEVLEHIPHDIYAMLLIALGATMMYCNQHDAGMLVLGGGLSVFKGKQ